MNKVDTLKLSIARLEVRLQKNRPDLQPPHDQLTLSALSTLTDWIGDLERQTPPLDASSLIKMLLKMTKNSKDSKDSKDSKAAMAVEKVLRELLESAQIRERGDWLLKLRAWFNRPYPFLILKFGSYILGCVAILMILTLLGIEDPRMPQSQSVIRDFFHRS